MYFARKTTNWTGNEVVKSPHACVDFMYEKHLALGN